MKKNNKLEKRLRELRIPAKAMNDYYDLEKDVSIDVDEYCYGTDLHCWADCNCSNNGCNECKNLISCKDCLLNSNDNKEVFEYWKATRYKGVK